MTLAAQFSPEWLGSHLVRLLLACLLSGVIGFEREFASHKAAGFRTHILVGLGAAIAMMTSEYAVLTHPDLTVDPTRIGAQVISGIGFLGAGAIIRSGMSVKGLTTAASLWAVACVGIACGTGFYSGALIATVLAFIVLSSLKTFEDRLSSNNRRVEIRVEAIVGAAIVEQIRAEAVGMGFTIREMHLRDGEATIGQQIRLVLAVPKTGVRKDLAGQLVTYIQSLDGVRQVRA